MKVLLFSNDLMPFGELPTSGGGLRCYQLMKGLESQGIEVVASMPGFTYLAEKYSDKIPEENREFLWQFDTQDDIFREVRPDAVLFASNWDHYNLKRKIDVPLIIDLHGSRLIETSMWGRPVSAEHKVKTFSRADCLLAAGRRQRIYFYGWLLQAGRIPKDEHFIRYIPVSLSPQSPQGKCEDVVGDMLPRFISGGGWFPWQNQSRAIFAICEAIEKRAKGCIDIYGTPHERQGNSAREELIYETYKNVSSLSENSKRINVHDYVGRSELIDIYSSASLAVEVMEYNLERELAFTTRTIEYMWAGLPVLYNNYGEVSEHIADYDAGWLVDPSDLNSINKVLDEIFEDAEALKTKGENASRLVKERFSWDKTILPLVEFLRKPEKAMEVEPVLGTVYGRPAYLNQAGPTFDVPFGKGLSEIEQRFVIPAENIQGVEVPLTLVSEKAREVIERVELRLVNSKGWVIRHNNIKGENLPLKGRLLISFPLLFRPRGGKDYGLRFKVVTRVQSSEKEISKLLVLEGLSEVVYPFVALSSGPLCGQDIDGEQQTVKAIRLSFLPEEHNRFYHFQLLCKRALWMIRRGEWRRVVRATRRRLPRIAGKIARRTLRASH